MAFDLDNILEDCLQRLSQGETLQACLSRYPAQAAELSPLLRAAARLEEQIRLRPSAAFKARARAQLYAHMEAHPRKNRRQWNILFPISRLALGVTALLLALALAGTALAQSALPGAAFYPWKLASEQAWRAVSPDPMEFDLALAERRVDEIVAVSGNATAQETAFKEYQRIVIDLQKYQNPIAQSRIQQALTIQEEKIKSTGFLPVDAATPIPTNLIQPTQIPVSTQDVLPLPKATLIPSILVPTHIIPTMVSTKIQLPTALPTKIQLPAALPTTIELPTILPKIQLPTILPTQIRIPTIIPPLPTLPGLP